jgi:hypothetical protein
MPRAKVKNVNSVITAAVEAAQSPIPTDMGTIDFPPVPSETSVVPGQWSESGSEDREDLSMPRLTLKHAIDTRFDGTRAGNYVWFAGDDFAEIKPPLTFIPLKWNKGFIERNPADGMQPITCDTKEKMEVEHNGTLEYGRPDKVYFSPMADIMLLLVDVKGLPVNALTLSIGKKHCAPVVFRVKNTSYEVAKAINSNLVAAKFRREVNPKFWDYSWVLGSVMKTSSQGGQYAVPTIKLGPATSAAERNELAAVAANL